MVGGAAGQCLHAVNVQSPGGREIEMSTKDPVPGVGSEVAEREVVAGVLHVLGEASGEERVIEIAHHERHYSFSHCEQFRVRRVDLFAAKRIRRREGCGVEGTDHQVVVGLIVGQLDADQALVGGAEETVVQRFFEGECPGVKRSEAILQIVDGEPKAVFLGGQPQPQVAHLIRQIGGIAFLQTEKIHAVLLHQILQLAAGFVFPQVVADGPYQESTSS